MQQLVSLALIGTANAAQDPAIESVFEALAPLIPESSREQGLLWLAGGATIYARAGAIVSTAAAPAAAADDVMLQAPAGSVRLLKAAIDGELDPLASWMAKRLQRANVRLPDELLPAALNLRDRMQAAHWLPALGERGRWLARQNPQWKNITDELPTDSDANRLQAWEEGNSVQRRTALAAQRRIDPAIARAWVAAALPREKAELRQQWVEALETGLSHDDADLLEQQLNDRSQSVRVAASALLARLPASACAARLRERAVSCVRWRASAKPTGFAKIAAMVGMAGSLELQVEPPDDLPKDWEQDGIHANPPGGEGKRAFWLRQLVGLINPRLWLDAAGAAPADLLPVMLKNDWAEALLHGVSAASCRFGDAAWAAAILALQAASPLKYLSQYEYGLWQTLPEDLRLAMIKARLDAGDLQGALDGLQHGDATWAPELSRQFATLLARFKPADMTPEVFQAHAQAIERCLVSGAEDVLPLLAVPVRECQAAAEQVHDWSGGMRNKLANRLSALLEAKLQFIKEMPL